MTTTTTLVMISFFFLFSLSSINSKKLALVIHWPVTYCRPPTYCKPEVTKRFTDFTIQSFLVYSDDFVYQDSCEPENALNPIMVEALREELDVEWPCLNDGEDNLAYWAREWIKHGTCSYFDQTGYFEHALNMRRRLYINRLFASANLKPSQHEPIQTAKFVEELSNGIAVPRLLCTPSTPTQLPELREIIFCMDGQANDFIDCKIIETTMSCETEFIWPLE